MGRKKNEEQDVVERGSKIRVCIIYISGIVRKRCIQGEFEDNIYYIMYVII